MKNQISVSFRLAETVSTFRRLVLLSLIALLFANYTNAQVASGSGQLIEQSIQTVYPTKDWVISDFVVTDPEFGANPKPGFNNRSAFQAAIDAAYNKYGGIVYLPAGNYEFHSTQTATVYGRNYY
jgi:polygalacturonase